MWVARMKIVNRTIDKDLSPKFDTAQDCLNYIKKNLVVLEYLAEQMQHFIDSDVDNKIVIRMGSYIRPYNLEQQRFCDGFDF